MKWFRTINRQPPLDELVLGYFEQPHGVRRYRTCRLAEREWMLDFDSAWLSEDEYVLHRGPDYWTKITAPVPAPIRLSGLSEISFNRFRLWCNWKIARGARVALPEGLTARLANGQGSVWQYAWRVPAMLGLLAASFVMNAMRPRTGAFITTRRTDHESDPK